MERRGGSGAARGRVQSTPPKNPSGRRLGWGSYAGFLIGGGVVEGRSRG
jgi:hypothetical protein